MEKIHRVDCNGKMEKRGICQSICLGIRINQSWFVWRRTYLFWKAGRLRWLRGWLLGGHLQWTLDGDCKGIFDGNLEVDFDDIVDGSLEGSLDGDCEGIMEGLWWHLGWRLGRHLGRLTRGHFGWNLQRNLGELRTAMTSWTAPLKLLTMVSWPATATAKASWAAPWNAIVFGHVVKKVIFCRLQKMSLLILPRPSFLPVWHRNW